MIASQPRANAILPFSLDVDTSDKIGHLVMASTADELSICDDEGATAIGVILKGALTTEKASIALVAGLAGTVKIKLAGPVTTLGERLQLNFDGRVNPDAGTGSRQIVGIALEHGVANDLIEAIIHPGIFLI